MAKKRVPVELDKSFDAIFSLGVDPVPLQELKALHSAASKIFHDHIAPMAVQVSDSLHHGKRYQDDRFFLPAGSKPLRRERRLGLSLPDQEPLMIKVTASGYIRGIDVSQGDDIRVSAMVQRKSYPRGDLTHITRFAEILKAKLEDAVGHAALGTPVDDMNAVDTGSWTFDDLVEGRMLEKEVELRAQYAAEEGHKIYGLATYLANQIFDMGLQDSQGIAFFLDQANPDDDDDLWVCDSDRYFLDNAFSVNAEADGKRRLRGFGESVNFEVLLGDDPKASTATVNVRQLTYFRANLSTMKKSDGTDVEMIWLTGIRNTLSKRVLAMRYVDREIEEGVARVLDLPEDPTEAGAWKYPASVVGAPAGP